jgi:amidase
LNIVVWPCNGDGGRADTNINQASTQDALRKEVLYSLGNCAIRQLGIPTISVDDNKMPVNLTFASKAYDDDNLFRGCASAFEFASKLRQ